MQTLDDVLEHYGILGMKWGVRRSDEEIARANNKRVKKGKPVTVSKDAETASKSRAKAELDGVSALSNTELEELNKRLNLEANYERLTFEPTPPPEVSKGKKATNAILNEAGKMAANIARSEGQRYLALQVRKNILGV